MKTTELRAIFSINSRYQFRLLAQLMKCGFMSLKSSLCKNFRLVGKKSL